MSVWLNDNMAQTQHNVYCMPPQTGATLVKQIAWQVHTPLTCKPLPAHRKIIDTSVCAKTKASLLSQSPDKWWRARPSESLLALTSTISLSGVSTKIMSSSDRSSRTFIRPLERSRRSKNAMLSGTLGVITTHGSNINDIAHAMIVQCIDRVHERINQRAQRSRVGRDDPTHQSPATTSRDADCFEFLAQQRAKRDSVHLHIRRNSYIAKSNCTSSIQ